MPPSTTQQLEDALNEAKKQAGNVVSLLSYGLAAFLGFKVFEAFRSKK